MKNFLAVILVFVFAQCAFAESNEYIVKFKSGFSNKSLFELKSVNGAVKSVIPQLNMAVVGNTASELKALQSGMSDQIEYIIPNGKVHALALAPSGYPREADGLWGMKAINAKDAWAITKGSKDVVLAISDTGTWTDHFELVDNLWHNPGETGNDAQGRDKATNKIDDDGNGYIDDTIGWNFETGNNHPMENHYHGTHVAGTIGAVGDNKTGVVGVNFHVSLMTVKFIGAGGEGSDDAAVRTIVYAADNGAKALNCSWGGSDYSQAIYDAIAYARTKGMIVVAASANDGKNTDKTPNYPSAYDLDNIIAVAATTNEKGRLASFSNYGVKTVDIAAPGENIYSTYDPRFSMLHRNWFEYLSGTSMATPHVTGSIGLIYAANPNLTWQEVRDILMQTASPSKYLTDKVASGGQLNVGAAVQKAAALALARSH